MTYVPNIWADGDCVMAADMNNIEQGIDRAQGDVMNLYGPTAAIPASDPLLVGRFYIETDLLQRIWRDNGAGWDLVITPGGGAWELIAETILGAPAATVTFAAIPGTYRILVMFFEARTDVAGQVDFLLMRLNGDGGNNYDYGEWRHFGAGMVFDDARAATSMRLLAIEGNTARASCFAPGMMELIDYAGTTNEKYVIGDGGVILDLSGDDDIRKTHGLGHWRNTAAITQIQFLMALGANFLAGCRFILYGIT